MIYAFRSLLPLNVSQISSSTKLSDGFPHMRQIFKRKGYKNSWGFAINVSTDMQTMLKSKKKVMKNLAKINFLNVPSIFFKGKTDLTLKITLVHM